MKHARSLFSPMTGRYAPIAFYYLLRMATCLPAVVAYAYYGNSGAAVSSGVGMGVIVMTLCTGVGVAYGHLWRTSGIGRLIEPDAHPRKWRLRSIGTVDFAGTLLVVFLSGGWGSPFWYFALTSLLVPCFYSSPREVLVKATAFVFLYSAILSLAGDSIWKVFTGAELHLYFGFIFTAFLVTIVVRFLGRVYGEAEHQRQQAQSAIFDLGTVIEVTQNMASVDTGEGIR